MSEYLEDSDSDSDSFIDDSDDSESGIRRKKIVDVKTKQEKLQTIVEFSKLIADLNEIQFTNSNPCMETYKSVSDYSKIIEVCYNTMETLNTFIRDSNDQIAINKQKHREFIDENYLQKTIDKNLYPKISLTYQVIHPRRNYIYDHVSRTSKLVECNGGFSCNIVLKKASKKRLEFRFNIEMKVGEKINDFKSFKEFVKNNEVDEILCDVKDNGSYKHGYHFNGLNNTKLTFEGYNRTLDKNEVFTMDATDFYDSRKVKKIPWIKIKEFYHLPNLTNLMYKYIYYNETDYIYNFTNARLLLWAHKKRDGFIATLPKLLLRSIIENYIVN